MPRFVRIAKHAAMFVGGVALATPVLMAFAIGSAYLLGLVLPTVG